TIEAIIRRDSLPSTFLAPAAALLAGGGLLKAEIDARRDPGDAFEPWCARGAEAGMPLAGAAARGAHTIESAGLVWGPGDGVPNEAGRDLLYRETAPPDFVFANYAFTRDELAALKALAISGGTFYRDSLVVFDAHAPLPGRSLVYVEGDVEI